MDTTNYSPIVAQSIKSSGKTTNNQRHAHGSGHHIIKPKNIQSAQRRAEKLNELLQSGATPHTDKGNREQNDETPDWRTAFEKDRDRILHSQQLRTLAGKTQVFINSPAYNERLRTRLTHTLEVAQIAQALAEQLQLNSILAHTIALGHDCGHGPLGHASEEAFSPYLENGFDHAVFGADVALKHLNLTEEVKDGIRNHSWRRPCPTTPEGEIVSWADRIAYLCHDYDDAVECGVLTPENLPANIANLLGTRQSEQINTLITALVENSIKTGTISLPEKYALAMDEFRTFNYTNIYHRPTGHQHWQKGVKMLTDVVDYTIDTNKHMNIEQIIAKVAALTDRGVIKIAEQNCGWTNPQQIWIIE